MSFNNAVEGAGPVEVAVKLTVWRLAKLDDIAQTFGATFTLRMSWPVPHGETLPSPEENDGDWRPFWIPRYLVSNVVSTTEVYEYFTTEEVDGEMHVVAFFEHI